MAPTTSPSTPPDLPPRPTASSGGLLNPEEALRHFELERRLPPPELALWVEHLWSVRWSLPAGSTYRSQVLTHPAVHLTVEWGWGPRHGVAMPAALVHGVVTRRFDIDLQGRGEVVGVRFRPGGFGAFTGAEVSHLTDRVVAAGDVLGPGLDGLTTAVIEASGPDRADLVWASLAAIRPGPDDRYQQLLDVVSLMLADRTLTTVRAVAAATGLSPRTLQRSFRTYVGVGPKWVLQRFRLHDAVALIDEGEVDDLAALAARLGWYDQAHFTRDFCDVVGVTPGRYLAAARTAAPSG